VARTSITVLAAIGLMLALGAIAGPAAAAAATKPKCVGAAARDAKRPCFNPTRAVRPSLATADLVTSSPCKLTDEEPEPVCTFGAPAAKATKHIALLGDSHALQWRSALDFVATSQGWQGYSLTAPGCPFSDAVRYLAEGIRAPCEDWYRAVLTWFRSHPEVTTVYTSQFAPMPLALPPGKTALEVKTAGFRRAWAALPKTVTRVIAIRDTPMTNQATADCLRDAIAAGKQRPGIACKVPRAGTVFEDAAVTTARQLRSKRYAFADLTSYFCSSAYCYPVIGGVLVYRDTFGHITLAYAESLGPYLLRRLRFLGEGGRRGARAGPVR
jgi:hypothetical protein